MALELTREDYLKLKHEFQHIFRIEQSSYFIFYFHVIAHISQKRVTRAVKTKRV